MAYLDGTDDFWDDGDQDFDLKIASHYVLNSSVYSYEDLEISTIFEDGVNYDNETAGITVSQDSFSWTNFKTISRDDSDDQTTTSSSITVTSNWISEEDESLVVGQDGIDFWQDCGSSIWV